MVRKTPVSDNEEKKRSRGRPKKNTNTSTEPVTSTGKRKNSTKIEEEPRSKKDRLWSNSTQLPKIDEEPLSKNNKLPIDEVFENTHAGVLLALGQGEFGQLGLGEDIISRKKPALLGNELEGKKIKKAVAGGMHTVCLTEDKKVYTFGCNDEGALGRPIADDSEEYDPGLVSEAIEGVNIIDITAGDSHTAALSDDGMVYLWGCFRDNHGKLGLVREWEGSKSPLRLHYMKTSVKRIASGCDHLAMLTEDGKVFTMGCGEQGQLGRLSRYSLSRGGRRSAGPVKQKSSSKLKLRFAEEQCLHPKAVNFPKVKGKAGKPIFVELFCGSYCTYAVSTNGDVFAFGLNNYNQMGIPDEESKYMPTFVASLSEKKWKIISGGLHHTILLDDQGHVYCLGRGDYGRLGLGEDVTIANEPTRITELEDIVHVATGPCVSFAVDKHGKGYSWGMGTNLQLTTGEEEDEWTPVKLCGKQLETRAVLTADGGGQHTVLLACDKSEIINGQPSE